ncbi:ABC transporter ATP-binding protein [Senegalia massiliensis]|uniref:sn-glycerol-3-phosphate ABC transporter ATP-binding protein UgpC n=1 Tax=Senegalia massiliensis TaxID=1720316 RepID=A0A845R0Q3_9CLOT|nr:sn-glycerol-3-phosphate ABC transporter ATP-binding protein UgpC [Senegalia massiliensis]NBI07824.1 sn-glycerol-3-phosphate ABC transporter ATP-binding protein UgpC [Senegalia massiliensis]
MSGLTFKNLEKVYSGGVKAVEDFNLEIKDKEFIVLVGPSGCGKSTTLRMVAGLEEISGGELYIGDKLVNNIPPKNRDIAMVFQNYALYPHMTVYDNMAFGLKLRKVSKDEIDKKVKEAAKILGIESLLDRKPKALSGGQRQRVALGRAIVRNPKVFLMDEPLSNLDAKLRVQTRTEISKLHKKLQTTFIYVTHDQTEAMTMGDRIVIMKDGLIQQADTPKKVYENPANAFVAGFIGSPQMNFFDGNIESTDVDNCHLVLDNSEVKIKIPEGRAKILKDNGHFGKKVIMGIRPEDIHDEKAFIEASEDSSFKAIVEVTEMMGSETYLYLNIFGNSAIARVNPRNKSKAGDEVSLAFDTNRIHLFDKETEKAIF